MKLLKKSLMETNRNFPPSGSVLVQIESEDDIYHLYNIISEGDHVETITNRRVSANERGNVDDAKKSDSVRITIKLEIQIESIEVNLAGGTMSCLGKIQTQHPQIKAGSFHRLDFDAGSSKAAPIKITKDAWSKIQLCRLKTAVDAGDGSSKVYAVVMEDGVAHLCLISANAIKLVCKVESSVVKKNSIGHEKTLEKFLTKVSEAVIKNFFGEGKVQPILLCSPNSLNASLKKNIEKASSGTNKKQQQETDKNRLQLLHSSNGYLNALNDLLLSPVLCGILANSKLSKEKTLLDEFERILSETPRKALYGYDDVRRGVDEGAVCKLLLSDNLFRSKSSVDERRQYELLYEDALNQLKKEENIIVFSTETQSGIRLGQFSGIAAILKYEVYWDEEEE